MRIRLIRIGNSRGVRLPKSFIEQAGLEDQVDLELRDGKLVLTAVARPRSDWDDAFRAMAERGDDALVHGEHVPASSWDEDEWEW